MTDLQHLRALLGRATKSTWVYDRDSYQIISLHIPTGKAASLSPIICRMAGRGFVADPNAEAIVALFNAAPALLAVVEAAEKWRDDLPTDKGSDIRLCSAVDAWRKQP